MGKEISDEQLLATLKRLERYADFTDSRFKIPFTNIRFGFDALIGLIPILGETIGLVMSLYIVYEATKLGVPLRIKMKMLGNVLVDWLIGLVPVIGDMFDVAYKANMRNMKLLVEYINQEYESRQQSDVPKRGSIIPMVILVLLVSLMTLWLTVFFFSPESMPIHFN